MALRERSETTETQSAMPSGGALLRLLPLLLLVAAVAAFALANTESTEVNFLFTEAQAPLIVVLLATAVVGAVIGVLLRHSMRRS